MVLLYFVSALILAGCFNPVAVESPVARGKPSPSAPFSVEIELDGEGVSARSLYGAERTAMPGAGGSMNLINNYANFSQLVVVDGTDGSIFYAAEARRQKSEEGAVFKVPPVNLDRSQLFLLLMGHLADGEESPTLLAAGFSNRLVDDERKVLLYMWPIQVDTEL
ncbi:MAG: hypothetical protein LBU18_03860, partial [Treponema sp.]|nr:hypothetical protein [Treponema sp.]